MEIKVTVVVPVYNISDDILAKCISSIVNQSLSDIEIFIIDDGSNKKCADLCDKLGSLDKRISVLHKDNGGVSTCRNYGIENSNAEWIAFVDADDWIESDYLENLIKISVEQNADIAVCDCVIEYEYKSIRNHFFCEDVLDSDICGKDRFTLQFLCPKLLRDSDSATDSGAPWAKLYRKKIIMDNNLRFKEELRRMQDNVFNLEAYEFATKIFYMNEPLYHYRKSTNSGFNRYNPYIYNNYITVFKYVENYINKYNKGNLFRKALDYKVIFSMYVILKNDFCHPDNKMSYQEQKNKLNIILQNKYYKNAVKSVDINILSFTEKILLGLMKQKSISLLKCSVYCKNLLFKLIGRGV